MKKDTIETLLKLMNELENEYGGSPYADDVMSILDALKASIETLEKQIPKKPKATDHDHEEYFTKIIYCGSCGESMCSYDYGRAWCEDSKKGCIDGHRFCQHCGQAIDWSEEEG